MLGGWDGEVLLESVEGLSEKVEGLSGNNKGWTNQPAYVLTQPRYRFLIFWSAIGLFQYGVNKEVQGLGQALLSENCVGKNIDLSCIGTAVTF